VPGPLLPPLAEWESFYVILGSSAAALTGLMFVVIALRAESGTADDAVVHGAFATPTIVHFCAVLLLAAVVTAPRHSVESLRVCFFVLGTGGLIYSARVILQARRQTAYRPVLSDWVWHGILPLLAYAALFGADVCLRRFPEAALRVVGGAGLLLILIGIHNAWDSALWLAAKRSKGD